MAKTDQVKDTYNPPSVSSATWEDMLFSEVEIDDIFWLREGGNDNPPYRKTSETQAGNTRQRTLHNFDARTKVYQRT